MGADIQGRLNEVVESERLNMEPRIILDLCGGTGAWSKPYRDAGYDVRVITLPEFDALTYIPPENIYGILAAPLVQCFH